MSAPCQGLRFCALGKEKIELPVVTHCPSRALLMLPIAPSSGHWGPANVLVDSGETRSRTRSGSQVDLCGPARLPPHVFNVVTERGGVVELLAPVWDICARDSRKGPVLPGVDGCDELDLVG